MRSVRVEDQSRERSNDENASHGRPDGKDVVVEDERIRQSDEDEGA